MIWVEFRSSGSYFCPLYWINYRLQVSVIFYKWKKKCFAMLFWRSSRRHRPEGTSQHHTSAVWSSTHLLLTKEETKFFVLIKNCVLDKLYDFSIDSKLFMFPQVSYSDMVLNRTQDELDSCFDKQNPRNAPTQGRITAGLPCSPICVRWQAVHAMSWMGDQSPLLRVD